MPKPMPRTVEKQDQRDQRRAQRQAAERTDEHLGQTGPVDLPGRLAAGTGDGTVQAQAVRLSDTRLNAAQRRALAAGIGAAQGNRHLQRVVDELRRDEEENAGLARAPDPRPVVGPEFLGQALALAHPAQQIIQRNPDDGRIPPGTEHSRLGDVVTITVEHDQVRDSRAAAAVINAVLASGYIAAGRHPADGIRFRLQLFHYLQAIPRGQRRVRFPVWLVREGARVSRIELVGIERVEVEEAETVLGGTWQSWMESAAGVEYARLRTQMEDEGYRFVSKVQAPSGTWEERSPEDDTPAGRVGWSIWSPEAWSWATTANVVAVCRRLMRPRPVDLGRRIGRATEVFYNVDQPVLAEVPNHFENHLGNPCAWAGTTYTTLTGLEGLEPRWDNSRQLWVYRNIPLGVSCTVTMPRWQNLAAASNVDRQEWARFMRCLRIHEQGHVDHAHDLIRNLAPDDREITGGTREEAFTNLRDWKDEKLADLESEDFEYDRATGHGERQGAVLRAPRGRP